MKLTMLEFLTLAALAIAMIAIGVVFFLLGEHVPAFILMVGGTVVFSRTVYLRFHHVKEA